MGSAHARNIRLNLCKLYDRPIRLLADHDFTVQCIQVELIARGRTFNSYCICSTVHESYCTCVYPDKLVFPLKLGGKQLFLLSLSVNLFDEVSWCF